MPSYSTEVLEEVWKAQEKQREGMSKRQKYYDGQHAILDRKEEWKDGNKKTNRVVNWAKFAVDLYVGAVSSVGFQVSLDSDQENPDRTAIDFYGELELENRLETRDVELFRIAAINGSSIELHEYKNSKIRITHHNPINWACLWDEDDNLSLAIHRLQFKSGTLFRGEVLENDVELMTVYDETTITDYQRVSGIEEWELIGKIDHNYGRIPVIVWRIDDTFDSVISDTAIKLNDEYNEDYSAAGDDLKATVDALLKVIGNDPNWILEHAAEIKASGIIPLASDSDADFITKGGESYRYGDHLTVTRELIHIEYKIPDIHTIVGVTGGTSGIALQLKFQPMQQHAASMMNFIKLAIRERIDLINARTGKTNKPKIENYTVTVQFVVPVNYIEEWQNIGKLKGIVSHMTQLRLLSQIDDPQKELENLNRENPLDETPEGAAADQEALTADMERNIKENVAVAIQAVADAALDLVTQTGAVERLSAQRQANEEVGVG